MENIRLKENIFWVGAIDWNVRNFHGHTYATERGTTYNAYLIIDDKVTLIDAVHKDFSQGLFDNIRGIVPLEKIDYIVVNHLEPDHTGSLPELLKLAPKAKLYGSFKCKEGLEKYYFIKPDFQVVRTGEVLKLGKRSLSFIEAPMLHWPDSMFSYCPEEKILFPNDAFGQHLATSGRFDDTVDNCALMDEAAKYYGNILWPLSSLVVRKIEQVLKSGIPIEMIAPSHGVIWRKDPAKIINSYLYWGKNSSKEKVVIVYETMWGNTAKLASVIAGALMDSGIEVKLFDLNASSRTQIIKEMLDAKGFVIGSSTHDNDMLANMAGFLELLKGFAPRERLGFCFGSYGWAGGAVESIENKLKSFGVNLPVESFSVKFTPSQEEIKSCYEAAIQFAKEVKNVLRKM
ncbi:MAG: FprA family A-type flavoprotein [Candidatus Omnitrophica bacterium]|nr:FprA family A-type flavoprotein [Candidatus Omnitrophota bacterium]